MKPHQIITLMTYPGTDNTLALPDHDDHIHVGFHPLFGDNGKLGAPARRDPQAGPVGQAHQPPRARSTTRSSRSAARSTRSRCGARWRLSTTGGELGARCGSARSSSSSSRGRSGRRRALRAARAGRRARARDRARHARGARSAAPARRAPRAGRGGPAAARAGDDDPRDGRRRGAAGERRRGARTPGGEGSRPGRGGRRRAPQPRPAPAPHRDRRPVACSRSRSSTRSPSGSGIGEGEQVAEGRWTQARELPPRAGRPRRSAALRPQERLAALLGGRDAPLAGEELALRARPDLDRGSRPRGGAAAAGRARRCPPRARGVAGDGDLGVRLEELRALAPAVDAAAERALRRRPGRRRRRGGRARARAPRGRPTRPQPPSARPDAATSPQSAATSASSSATTSPSSFTAARASHGVGPCVTIATAPPLARVIARQLRRSGGPRARSRCRAAGRRPRPARGRAPARLSGSHSPNSTTSGLSGAPQSQRGTPSASARMRAAHVGERVARAARRARGVLDRAVHLDELARPRPAVEAVDVLRDHGVEPRPRRSSSTSASWAPLGRLSSSACEALAVEAPEAVRVAPPGVDVRDLHRVDVRPQPGRRACGSRGCPRAPRSPPP